MVDGIEGMRRVAVYVLVATITTWCGIFLNFALLPTITYHKGTLIFANILAWWLPGVFALNEILFGDFNRYVSMAICMCGARYPKGSRGTVLSF